MTQSSTISSQLAGFGVFALVILLLGSFQKTHEIAVYLLGFLALVLVINIANGKGTS